MKYIVSVKVDGRIDVEVEADSFEEAKVAAELEMVFLDWNGMDAVDIMGVNAEDENGKFIDY